MEKNLLSGLMQAARPTEVMKCQWVTPPGHSEPAIVEVRVRPLSVIPHHHPDLRQAWIAWWEAAVRRAEHRRDTLQKFPGLFEEGGIEPYGFTPEVQEAMVQDGDLGDTVCEAEREYYRLKEEAHRLPRTSAIRWEIRWYWYRFRAYARHYALCLLGRREIAPTPHEERVQEFRKWGRLFPEPLRSAGAKESKAV
jgi:hypothetical protein